MWYTQWCCNRINLRGPLSLITGVWSAFYYTVVQVPGRIDLLLEHRKRLGEPATRHQIAEDGSSSEITEFNRCAENSIRDPELVHVHHLAEDHHNIRLNATKYNGRNISAIA